MKEKQLIQKKLLKNADLFEEIYGFMKKDAWVFISADLFWRLRKEYPYKFSKRSDRCRFIVEKLEKEWQLTVYQDCGWNNVVCLARINWENLSDFEQYYTSDPSMIVFLE